MSDALQYVHYAVSALALLTGVVLAYLKYLDHQSAKDNVCEAEFQQLKTKVSVMEERLNNEIASTGKNLDKIADRIEQITEKLYE